jgi:hypothetical protein
MLVSMPVISSFFGITIRMFFSEHGPPHFHAEHQRDAGTFDFDGKLIKGRMRSAVARKRVRLWASRNRQALEDNWVRVRGGVPLERIAPLS